MLNSSLSEPTIGIVIINFNGFELTCDCVDSILRADYEYYRIYIIDNASTDGSGTCLESKYSKFANVLLSEENLGTTGANNIGMERAFRDGCDAALILNNDTVLPEEAISSLVSQYDPKRVVVPLIVYYSNPELAWYAGGHLDHFNNARHDGMRKSVDTSDFNRDVTYAPTCCFLIPRAVYDIVGAFDENYFMYWEDVDYCIQLRRHDIPIRYVPGAKIFHRVSASSGGEGSPFGYYYSTRNRLYGIDKLKLPKRTWLWARLALLRGVISGNSEFKYASKAWKDYRNGIRGRVELN